MLIVLRLLSKQRGKTMKKIAILGAMELEIVPILEKLENYKKTEYANNTYYLAEYNGYELVIAYSKIGKVFSTLTATIMFEHFGADIVFFSGVAGSISQELELEDIVIATATAQHDFDLRAFGRKMGEVPSSTRFIKTSKNLQNIATQVAKDMGLNFKEGVIATGDKFVNTREQKEFIAKEFDAVALEMEGASVNLVANELGKHCLIIRSISDTADDGAVDNFYDFAVRSAEVSARLIFKILENI